MPIEASKKPESNTLPVIPLRDLVLFPGSTMTITVGRRLSLLAIEAALATEEKQAVFVTQRDPSNESPGTSDLFLFGTLGVILLTSAIKQDAQELKIRGTGRVAILSLNKEGDLLLADVHRLTPALNASDDIESEARDLVDLGSRYLDAQQDVPKECRDALALEDPLQTAYSLMAALRIETHNKQAILEAPTVMDALKLARQHLREEIDIGETRRRIQDSTKEAVELSQREYYLREQMKAIQRELGEQDSPVAELQRLYESKRTPLSPEIQQEMERTLERLARSTPGSADYQVFRGWFDLVLDLPWDRSADEQVDIRRARIVLDEDHRGLRDVKDRILEHLGILKLNPKANAPILCLTGPPGVGKTSLGKSIARALNRPFERLSLGGLRDEAELRGHRRTYVGALPGRIIEAVRRARVNNPVIMLDEIDKIGHDFRGDPAAALLEILDRQQNREFRDNYLELSWDLSRALFIATANTLDPIPSPLLDRMEVLPLPGYSEEEKLEIARTFILPQQLAEAGLDPNRAAMSDDALKELIRGWTREAGLRQLERAVARLIRKIALRFAEGNTDPVLVRPGNLVGLLGLEMYTEEDFRTRLRSGVALGMAKTESGGEIVHVESALLPKGGRALTLTGQIGDTMRESAQIAHSYMWSRAESFGIDPNSFVDSGVHIHLPAGSVAKDGPSAGVAIIAALTSLYTGQTVRSDTAMTGEITLSGAVLRVGGIKEKVLAARRAGMTRLILPRGNHNNTLELPEGVRAGVEFLFVDTIEQLLEHAIPTLELFRNDFHGIHQDSAQ